MQDADVFISYSSRDRRRVLEIADVLSDAGIHVWMDRDRIEGGMNYGPEIVRGIKAAKVLMLMSSDAALHSRNVKQEVQLAWKYQRPYLPLLLDTTSFPEQFEYWLEGWQWIEVFDLPRERWLPSVLRALRAAGLHAGASDGAAPPPRLSRPALDLAGLRSIAKLTDQIWALPAERAAHGTRVPLRDLGAPQDDARHGYKIGERVCIAIESDRSGYLTLIDEGTSGAVYSLCPSHFAPGTSITAGRHYVPQPESRYQALAVTGKPGREHLLAIITESPLRLDWIPADPRVPARVLSADDINDLLAQLQALPDGSWTALATYFDVLA